MARLLTLNLDYGADQATWAARVQKAAASADILCFQEAKYANLRAAAPPGWEVFHVTDQGSAKASNAIMWDSSRATLTGGSGHFQALGTSSDRSPKATARVYPQGMSTAPVPPVRTPSGNKASLAGRQFRLNPQSVQYGFNAKVTDIATVGGKVIQVFGTSVTDLTVEGTFGKGGWQEQEAFLAKMKEIGDASVADPTKQPPRFRFPAMGWDMLVYLKAYRTPDGGRSVVHSPQIVAPRWTLTLHIVADNSGLKKVAQDKYLDRLAMGIGFRQNKYNGPMGAMELDDTIGGMSIKEYLASEFGASGVPTGNQEDGSSGTSWSDARDHPKPKPGKDPDTTSWGPDGVGNVVTGGTIDPTKNPDPLGPAAPAVRIAAVPEQYVAWTELTTDAGTLTVASLHAPPMGVREVAYGAYATKVAEFIGQASSPVFIGGDWNWQVDADPGAISRYTGVKFYGSSIDGFAASPEVSVQGWRADATYNTPFHRAIIATV